jgi:hypothetical protein
VKEFMLLIRNEIDHNTDWPEEKTREFFTACENYIMKLKRDGKLKSAQPLMREGHIISGTRGSWKSTTFDENNEIVVGYYHILAKDIEEAIEISKQNPEFEFGKTARIEVRPVKMKEVTTGFQYPNS